MIDGNRKRNAASQNYRKLWMVYLRPQLPSFLVMSFLVLVSIGLQLINPLLLQSFIDTALNRGPYATLITLGVLFVALSLSSQIISVGATYMSERVAWTATNWLRKDLVAQCLSLDMSFHQAHTPGSLIERVDGDADILASFFSQTFIQLAGNALLLLGIIAILFREDWRLGTEMLVFTSLALFVLFRIRRYAVSQWDANRQKSADFFGLLGEHLEGSEEIRANGALSYIMFRFYFFLRGWFPVARNASIGGFIAWISTLIIFGLGNIAALLLGAYLLSVHAITIGTVYLVFYYTNLVVQPMQQIRNQFQGLQAAEAGVKRVQQLLSVQPIIKDDSAGALLPLGPLEVDFNHVTFGYKKDEPVLSDVTFHLAPGRVLGIVGRTGSGKSTLARLLLRFYDAQEGVIALAGTPIASLRLREVRRQVGLVTQDVQLFHGTVRDNLTFFDQSIADQQIVNVLRELGLAQWYETLPQGLDSPLQSNGEGLSAGEAQLLACARVFLANPGLVILDEASSRLDAATERILERAIKGLFTGRTGIIIAHRLETVQQADDIIVLKDGMIAEYGTKDVLRANSSSYFAQLVQAAQKEV